jgi:hypothetical protein
MIVLVMTLFVPRITGAGEAAVQFMVARYQASHIFPPIQNEKFAHGLLLAKFRPGLTMMAA